MAKEKDAEKAVKAEKAEKTAEKKDKKTSGKSSAKKQNKVGKWFKDLRSEIKKVVWPSWKTIRGNTSVVLATVFITSVFVGILDFGLVKLIELLYKL